MSLFNKASALLGLEKTKFLPADPIEKIVESMGQKFSGLLDLTFTDRVDDLENTELGPQQVKAVIAKYSKQNIAIAAACAAVPGPLGILSSAGELVLISGNQFRMIYDLGCAFNKEDFLTKDLLLDVPLQAMGVSTELDEMQNNLANLTESPYNKLKEKATNYANVIAIKNLKKSLVKCVPVGGSLLMSIWTKKSTMKIGKIAENFLDDAIVLPKIQATKAFQEEEPKEILIERIKILISLMEQNGQIKDSELAFVVPIIENAPLEEKERNYLLTETKRIGSHFTIDFDALRQFPDVVDDLISDLAVLAKRDGLVGKNELAFLKHIANLLDVPDDELMVILN